MCRITNPNPRIIAYCDKPYKLMYVTITFRSFTPQPGGLEFQPGQDYYFICEYKHIRIFTHTHTHAYAYIFPYAHIVLHTCSEFPLISLRSEFRLIVNYPLLYLVNAEASTTGTRNSNRNSPPNCDDSPNSRTQTIAKSFSYRLLPTANDD